LEEYKRDCVRPRHEYALATEYFVFAQLAKIKITSYAAAMLFLP
jgi:hypothetical protein